MYDKDLVSVIIFVDKKLETVSESVKSVLNQTYTSLEVLLCGKSADVNNEILNDFKKKDKRVRIIDCGQAVQNTIREIGIKKASGKWIAFLDSGDRWLPAKIEAQLFVLNQYKAKACCTNAHLYSDRKRVPLNCFSDSESGSCNFFEFSRQNFVVYSSILVDSLLAKEYGNFFCASEEKSVGEYAFCLVICCHTEFVYLSNTFVDCFEQSTGEYLSMLHSRECYSKALHCYIQWKKKLSGIKAAGISVIHTGQMIKFPFEMLFKYCMFRGVRVYCKMARKLKCIK